MWGSLAPGLTNAILSGPVTSPLIKYIAGVAKERQLPSLASKSFVSARNSNGSVTGHGFSRAVNRRNENAASAPERSSGPNQVVLWPDTWNNYYHPRTLAAAETVLTEAGFNVIVPQGHICCGRPLYDFGHLDSARAYLANVLDRMAPHIETGVPFIFLEPSCASVFRDELPELFPSDPRAKKMRDQVWLLADWLAARAPGFVAGRLNGTHVLIHGHCHHKSVFGGPKKEIALLREAGAEVELIEAGCRWHMSTTRN